MVEVLSIPAVPANEADTLIVSSMAAVRDETYQKLVESVKASGQKVRTEMSDRILDGGEARHYPSMTLHAETVLHTPSLLLMHS